MHLGLEVGTALHSAAALWKDHAAPTPEHVSGCEWLPIMTAVVDVTLFSARRNLQLDGTSVPSA
jgi:hypothetical protein